MNYDKIRRIAVLLLKLVAIEETITFIFAHYFFEITPTIVSPTFISFFLTLVALNWCTKNFQKKNYFRPSHISLTFAILFLAVHFRAGVVWALNTFPLRDANMVMLTLQEPFDDFAYSMIKQYLSTTIPQALIITAILTAFLYALLSSTKKRFIGIGVYFAATIALLISDIPILNYIYILNGEPEKNASYSEFFVKNYINPDSVKITPPDQKRNLILIYLESMEIAFSDREHGGNQEENLIPEITKLALQNISFGKNGKHIGGGINASGTGSTFSSLHTRSLGIPYVINYAKTPILHHYKSMYKILNEHGYKQIFFQGNPGLYEEFKDFVLEHKVDESYGTDDLIPLLNMSVAETSKKQGFKNIQDKETFKFASQILDTISEPFSLTFFTIDTHAPHGLYDPDCIKADNENNEEDRLKAAERCVSKELDNFLTSLKSKPFYGNTSIVIFGDHIFMGTALVNETKNRKWVNIFINAAKKPIAEEKRLFTSADMFPTILSAMNFNIEGNRLGFGTDLFSDKKTLIESIGLDALNTETENIQSHLIYESYLLKKDMKNKKE